MTATVAQLAARALKKVGLSPVAVADRPTAASTVSLALIAARALRMVGANPVAEADAASNSGTVTVTALGNRVLQRLGFNPVAVASKPSAGTNQSVTLIADRALRLLGANPIAEASAASNSGTVTVANIATRALRRLAVVDAEETPATADQTLAETDVTAVHEQLAAINYVTWASSAIPTYAAEWYVIMAADRLKPAFGMTPSADEYMAAREACRLAAMSGATGQALAETEVNAAHQAANALGLVTFTTSAIPEGVAVYYARMAAVALDAAYGKQFDQAAYDAALMALRRQILSSSTGQTLAETKISAVHEALAASNIVTWASSAIPNYAAEQYVVLAANLLAPTAGMAVDVPAGDAAMASLRVIALSGAAGQTLAEAEVTSAHQALNSLGYVPWASSAIPEQVAPHYATMAAVRLSPAYGKPMDEAAWQTAVDMVRRYTMSGSVGQAIAEEKVRAAHIDLDARGLTRWDLLSLPDYAEEAYVLMAAELLAAEVGQPPFNGGVQTGERMIRRVIQLPSARASTKAVFY